MRVLLWVVAVMVLVLGVMPALGEDAKKMKVGLMVVGSTNDGGWNQLAKDSLDAFAKQTGAQVAVRQNVSKDQAAAAIRQFDSRGFDLVICHGYEYLEVVRELSDPAKAKGGAVKVKLAVSGGDVDSPHFQSLLYDLGGSSYQLGIIAAKTSKTGKLGFVGGAPFPTVTVMKRGFEAGAKSVNPNVTVAEQYTGWDDPAKAKRQTEAFIEQGIDVVMQNVDAASRGVFEAVKEYNAKGDKKFTVYTFGANSDQNGNTVAGDFTLASAVIRMDEAFARVLKDVQEGKFKGGVIKEDLASGVSVTVINPKLKGNVISDETMKLVEEAGKKLSAGEIKIPDEKK